MLSTDIYSISNPALGSLILWSFLQGYEVSKKDGCSFPLIFLPIPLVLSQSIRDEFKGTNAETGLYTWITRKQSILINLHARIQKSSTLTRNAVIFGCTNEILTIREDGTFLSRNNGLNKSRIKESSHEIKEMINLSKRLGVWLSQINSTSSILNSLGITL